MATGRDSPSPTPGFLGHNAAMVSKAALHTLSDNVHIWSPTRTANVEPTWGWANCGLITSAARGSSPAAAAWIDTPYDRGHAEEFLRRCVPLLPEQTGIGTIVLSHANGDHSWGTGPVPGARVISSAAALRHIAHEPEPSDLMALMSQVDPASPLGWYLKQHWGHWSWADTHPATPTETFSGERSLTIGSVPLRLVEVSGHTEGDIIIELPEHGVVFAGDLVFGSTAEHPGEHPVHWSGPLAAVAAGCRQILDLDVETIVPGHGPVLNRGDLLEHIAYLDELSGYAQQAYAQGLTSLAAAEALIASGWNAQLGLEERLAITLQTEWDHLSAAAAPTSMVELVTRAATLAWNKANSASAVAIPRPRQAPAPIST